MINKVYNIFYPLPKQSETARELSVDDFVRCILVYDVSEYEKKLNRPIKQDQKQFNSQQKQAAKDMQDIQKVFKSVSRVSEKYIGCEAYVIMRMHHLSKNPERLH